MQHRKTRLIADRFYHIYNRGNDSPVATLRERQSIFFDRENCIYFLRSTKEHIVESDITCGGLRQRVIISDTSTKT